MYCVLCCASNLPLASIHNAIVHFSRNFTVSQFHSKMPANKDFERKCEICLRSILNDRVLGRLQHTKTISAHVNCVLYSPVSPDSMSLASRPDDDAIAGVKSRFIRDEGARAKKLVIFLFSTFFHHIVIISSPFHVSSIYCSSNVIIASSKELILVAVRTRAVTPCSYFVQKNTTWIVVSTPGLRSLSARVLERFQYATNIAMQSSGIQTLKIFSGRSNLT